RRLARGSRQGAAATSGARSGGGHSRICPAIPPGQATDAPVAGNARLGLRTEADGAMDVDPCARIVAAPVHALRACSGTPGTRPPRTAWRARACAASRGRHPTVRADGVLHRGCTDSGAAVIRTELLNSVVRLMPDQAGQLRCPRCVGPLRYAGLGT